MARKGAQDRGIFERPTGSGVWWVLYYDQHGRRHREKVGPKSLARQVYAKRKTAIKEEVFFPEKVIAKKRNMLLADAITGYLEGARANKRTWKTDEAYGRLWVGVFKGKTLEEIEPADIEKWKRARLESGAKPATVNRPLAMLKTVFNWAKRNNRVTSNPLSSVRLLVENNARCRYLSEDEEGRLRDSMDPASFELVEFALLTGLRQEEQFGLKWQSVDLVNRVLTVPRSKHGEKRHIPLGDRVVELLQNAPSRLKSDWVFPSQTGKTALSGHNFYQRVFRPAIEKAGIEDFVWHDLRHDFASKLVMKGVDLYVVQKLLGHKSIAMTQRYAHLAPDHLRLAVNKIGAVSTLVSQQPQKQPLEQEIG